jgi:hypothetical protein
MAVPPRPYLVVQLVLATVAERDKPGGQSPEHIRAPKIGRGVEDPPTQRTIVPKNLKVI